MAKEQEQPGDSTEETETKKRVKRPGAFWRRLPYKIYADNFGFGVNRYQCMIDYLDSKDSGGNPRLSELRLPLLEDRCLDSYSSKKPFRFYDNFDIDNFIDKGEEIRAQIRQNDIATPGNVLRRTHTNWSMTKKYVQLVKKSNVIDYRKVREEAQLEALGLPSLKVLKSLGISFARGSMEPINLTLYKAHNNLDHAIYMNARRERLGQMDHQMDGVINQLSGTTEDLNRRAKQELDKRNRSRNITAYDNAQNLAELAMVTEDISARNRLRRQLDFEALSDGVDEIMRYDSARNRACNNLRALDDQIVNMEGEIGAMRRRHREERGEDDYDVTLDALNSMARRKARKTLNLSVNDEDLDDPELARLKMRRSHSYAPLDDPAVTPFRRANSRPDVVSDVQSRVLQRAGQIAGQTSTQRHVNNRARYINIYVPRHTTADPGLIIKPTRTELNIDHMARTLAAKGRIQRKFQVDEETDLPVSRLNTYSRDLYRHGGRKPVLPLPSISRMAMSAICRARARNALQGR